MLRFTMRTLAGFLIASLCFTGFALSQKPTPSSPPTLKRRPPADHRLYLDVVVADKAGQMIPDLSQADFTLLDNGRTQPLVSVQPVSGANRALDPGVQIVFVLDAVNNSIERVTYARLQLENFLREDNGRLSWPTLVILFTETATRIESASTRDGNTLAAILEANPTGLRALGRSAADDRADLSISTLSRIIEQLAHQPGRKLVIWLSSGWPLLPGAYLTEKNERSIFGGVIDLTDALQRARITCTLSILWAWLMKEGPVLSTTRVFSSPCAPGTSRNTEIWRCRCWLFKAAGASSTPVTISPAKSRPV